MTYEPSDKIGGLSDAEMQAFLMQPWNGRIATLDAEGWPYVAPVWYEYETASRTFLVVGRERADWVLNIRLQPAVTFRVDGTVFTGRGRAVDAAREPDLAAAVRGRMEAKYDWSAGLIVELRPD